MKTFGEQCVVSQRALRSEVFVLPKVPRRPSVPITAPAPSGWRSLVLYQASAVLFAATKAVKALVAS
jgi:hypothetical protein